MATAEQMERLHAVVPAAQAAQRRYGVPSSVTLGQWILESSWGTSQLALQANNFFGVKAHHLAAPENYIEFPTAEYESGRKVLVHALFERYYDAADSFTDHASLLATAARYRMAMLARNAPEQMARRLQTAGYSTNPQYAQALIALMREYDLYQYDTLPPATAAKAQEVAA